MPIESGAVRADKGETKSFTHVDGEDIYEIRLYGSSDGGLAGYSRYFKRWPFPRTYIGGNTLTVRKGEEREISSTGVRVKGT